ncbi:hypothetical protein SJAG_02970 [Schizosaccharomyces japonicus yFS275]|uniref:Uncharacterized protein n=1 Tax=Schizosaccharomyces japonicus (strain yFS275 / FY16936) TaxID=402676 RepID=B6K2Z2_SCHJY|nr:hypothetical protein SJAG_02970 [Schizosaccharomyces japonicus yFS275]EEB07849.1 hypothetical protein SJAG_02970 [Schizosaccharomyces japonicus yFS275]
MSTDLSPSVSSSSTSTSSETNRKSSTFRQLEAIKNVREESHVHQAPEEAVIDYADTQRNTTLDDDLGSESDRSDLPLLDYSVTQETEFLPSPEEIPSRGRSPRMTSHFEKEDKSRSRGRSSSVLRRALEALANDIEIPDDLDPRTGYVGEIR